MRSLAAADRALVLVGAGAAALGIAALLLDVYGIVGMPFTVSFVALPGLLVLLVLAVWAGRVGRLLFLRRLVTGLVAGVAATAAYDVSRPLLALVVPGPFDPFRAHPVFGRLMLGPEASMLAVHVAGWGYHLWTGLSFAVMYALLAGPARWWWGLVWAMTLESATILVYPNLIGISRTDVPFVAVSLLGHACYGVVLGVLTRRRLAAAELGIGPLAGAGVARGTGG